MGVVLNSNMRGIEQGNCLWNEIAEQDTLMVKGRRGRKAKLSVVPKWGRYCTHSGRSCNRKGVCLGERVRRVRSVVRSRRRQLFG